MKQSAGKIWEILLREGLVEGDAPEATGSDSPWYVKALLGFSGWLAAIFLFGFVGIGFQFIVESSIASLVTGSLMISGAYAILRIPKNEFIEHLALAVSLTGQALLVWAIFEFVEQKDDIAWVIIALVQAFLAVVIPNFLHRVFSSSFSAVSLFMALFSFRWPYLFGSIIMLFSSWLWLHEFRYPEHMKKIRGIGYGLVLALIAVKGFTLLGLDSLGWRAGSGPVTLLARPWAGEVLAGMVMLYVVIKLLLHHGHSMTGRLSLMVLPATILIAAASLEARGVTTGLLIILLGFNGGNRVLTGLGITSLLFYIGAYYYQLDLTLLVKSQSLLILGLVLLGVRWLLLRILPQEQEAGHAA